MLLIYTIAFIFFFMDAGAGLHRIIFDGAPFRKFKYYFAVVVEFLCGVMLVLISYGRIITDLSNV